MVETRKGMPRICTRFRIMNKSSESSLSTFTLDQLIASCQHERSTFRTHGETHSPACLEIFRRAFAGDQDAWTAIYTTFSSLMRLWVGVQHVIEPDDAIQEAFRAFARHAPLKMHLETQALLSPVLAYLRKCTKTAIIRLLREYKTSQQVQEQIQIIGIDDIQELISHQNLAEETTVRMVLHERIPLLLFDDNERLVYAECLINGCKPAELIALYPKHFTEAKDIYKIQQRIIRRLYNDTGIRELVHLPPSQRQKTDSIASHRTETLADHPHASLTHKQHTSQGHSWVSEIAMDDQAKESDSVNIPCDLDQDQLLDYVLGSATLESRRLIEQSPSCMLAAQRLAQELAPLMSWLRRLECPDANSLVEYHEQQLDSTTQLIIHRHISDCPHCQAEIQLLDKIDAIPLEARPGQLRRLVEAIFQSPLTMPQPLRGDMLTFTAPTISIHLSMRISRGQPRTWTLRGQARTTKGLQAQALIEAVTLHCLDTPDALEYQGSIERETSFVFRKLPAGDYSLHVLTSDEEIVIRRIIIGERQ